MGAAPPVDFPPPDDQDKVSADASMSVGKPVVDLCSFKLPFAFSVSLHIPDILPKIPTFWFKLGFGLNCSLDNPLDVTASSPFGGGRIGSPPKNPTMSDDY